MKLRNYLASLVLAISEMPAEQSGGRGLHHRPRPDELEGGRVPVLAGNPEK
ncbi:MAG TPA: hypothetical protein VMS09_19310 [Paenibacillus sp.]|uniref:hypothetical protein n=1 Tax=Paenibacillus sp. TaxID=58172 RepID=UPI002C17B3F0|nr:hypothetical protein [Paenibacillus sp.]HUC94135.1 hypothetical protein [Paenibacillus sp.]